jgi:hypothetical protein
MMPPEYVRWASMKTRCSNPKTVGWKNYGGRGISVCPLAVEPTPERPVDRVAEKHPHLPPSCSTYFSMYNLMALDRFPCSRA